jgi:rubredoxin
MADGYGSHLPVLELLTPEGGRALETGCGLYSTAFFVERCSYVLSYEMQEPAWAERVLKELNNPANLDLIVSPGAAHTIMLMEELEPNFDIALIDGHGESRPEQAMSAMELAPIVVCHDTEAGAWGYHWERIKAPAGWERYDVHWTSPECRVYSRINLDSLLPGCKFLASQ